MEKKRSKQRDEKEGRRKSATTLVSIDPSSLQRGQHSDPTMSFLVWVWHVGRKRPRVDLALALTWIIGGSRAASCMCCRLALCCSRSSRDTLCQVAVHVGKTMRKRTIACGCLCRPHHLIKTMPFRGFIPRGGCQEVWPVTRDCARGLLPVNALAQVLRGSSGK